MGESDLRLSEAFPPGFKNNNTYHAKVHSFLSTLETEIDLESIEFKKIENESELEEIKKLHKEWFPVEYPDAFFREMYGGRYQTLLAIYRAKVLGQKKTETFILGSITYEILEIDNNVHQFSIKQLCNQDRGLYIVTFGVVNELRKKGLAGRLLDQVIQIAKERRNIKYIYLDVVTYNKTAINFYLKHGFRYIYCKENNYLLFSKWYHAGVYALFLNGGKKAWYSEDYIRCAKKCLRHLNVFSYCRGAYNFLCKKRMKNPSANYMAAKLG